MDNCEPQVRDYLSILVIRRWFGLQEKKPETRLAFMDNVYQTLFINICGASNTPIDVEKKQALKNDSSKKSKHFHTIG